MNNGTEKIFLLSTSQSNLNASANVSNNLEDGTNSNTCRTCATVTEFVIPIFHGEGIQNNLVEKIHKHLPIRVSEDDGLPQGVCYQCTSTLLAWHELVTCCEQADQVLRTRRDLIKARKEAEEQELKAGPSNISTVQKKTDKKSIPQKKTRKKSQTMECSMATVLSKIVQENDTKYISNNQHTICMKCGAIINTEDDLVQHWQSEHREVSSEDTTLQFMASNVVTLEHHSDNSSIKSYTESDNDMVNSKAMKQRQYFCPLCESFFTTPLRLICHLNSHKNIMSNDGFTCIVCEQIFPDTKLLVEHIQTLHIQKNSDATNICKSCGYKAKSMTLLHAHVAETHSKKENEKISEKPHTTNDQKYIPVECPHCNKIFSNKYNMKMHIKSRHENNRYNCDQCGKSYNRSDTLKLHRKTFHSGELSVHCEICGEGFPTKYSKDIHCRIHTGVNPYVCDTCGKGFRVKNTLDRHIEMHYDVRNYKCEICLKCFRKKSHLNGHMKTHYK